MTSPVLASHDGGGDLGAVGPVWPVAEPDMRLAIVAEASGVDWSGIRDELRDGAADFTRTLDGWRVPAARETETRRVDPSIVAEEPIEHLARQPDGTYRWEVLVEAGTRVNPLETAPPRTWLLVFDGDDEDQREMAEAVVSRHGHRVVPVLTRGDPQRVARDWGTPAYRAQAWHFERLGITHVPALAGVHPDDPLRIRVTQFSRPWLPSEVEEYLP